MWPEVYRQALRDARRGWLVWSASLLAYTLLVLAFYPSIRNDPAVNELMRNLPEALRQLVGQDLTSPAGYVGGRLLSLMPALLSVYAALTGAALLAGAEERGWLELPLAQPVTRRDLLLGTGAALLTLVLGLGAVLFVAVWGLGAVFQAALPAGLVLQTAALHTLGAWVFGALALAVGAATGRAGPAAAAGAGLGVALLVAHTLSSQVPALRDLGHLNPWTLPLGGQTLREAVSLRALPAEVAVGAALLLLAWPLLERRDLGR
ncbi:ABC transporter permease subunit [Deinococcus multiflagellatus]|uniref:ABC transporter permease subunit n=1 Tax=Deinococcus multiflagellatus TaxID=1656887 RepID=A0ABW1ZIN7_9DEIO|nr:ABC transporter permease subunit [Deinococcus multiflagellatus]MBZ9714540.1 ABC transporter permease subunit [Deinococcus multiflagellatus]